MKTYLLFFTFMLIGGAVYWFYSAELFALITGVTAQAEPVFKTVTDTWHTVSTNPAFPIVTTGLTFATPIISALWIKYKETQQKAEANQQIVQANMQGAQAVGQVEVEKQALQQQLSTMKDEVTILNAQKLDATKFTELLDQKQREVDRLHSDLASAERSIRNLQKVEVKRTVP